MIAALHSAREKNFMVAQPAQHVELSDAYAGLDFGFILWVISAVPAECRHRNGPPWRHNCG